jgi:lipopolysaccharide biosynthesis regulator YciM
LLREAVALHDRGQYDEAIGKYQQILNENPDDVEALYEMGFSYAAKRDYQKSLEIGLKGSQYKSNLLQRFYTMVGNNLDHLGQPEKALKVYREGLKQFPREGQLHYNMAITLLGMKKSDDAKKSLKQALKVTPNHASSHLALSQLWLKENYKIPALLAACRFLMVEPKSQRSPAVSQIVNQIVQGSAQKGKDPNSISVLIDSSPKNDEGDFDPINAAMGLLAASRLIEKNKDKTEAQLFAASLSTLFEIMAEGAQKSSGFAWEYYRPYFSEMSRRKLTEAFCHYILQSTNSEEANKWLTQNFERARELLDWSKNYQWTSR